MALFQPQTLSPSFHKIPGASQLSIINKIFCCLGATKKCSSLTNTTNMIILSLREFKGTCRFHNVISSWRFSLYITVNSGAGLMLPSLEMSKCLLPHEEVKSQHDAMTPSFALRANGKPEVMKRSIQILLGNLYTDTKKLFILRSVRKFFSVLRSLFKKCIY